MNVASILRRKRLLKGYSTRKQKELLKTIIAYVVLWINTECFEQIKHEGKNSSVVIMVSIVAKNIEPYSIVARNLTKRDRYYMSTRKYKIVGFWQ